eukprot:gene8211-9774_t
MSTVFPDLISFLRLHCESIRHVKCLSSKSLYLVAIYVRNLETLAYVNACAISELSEVLWVNSSLQELRLEGVYGFNLENLGELNLAQLRLLSLWETRCNDEVLSRLICTTNVLLKLDIGQSVSVTDAGVIAIAQHCPQLRSLGLQALPISDSALARLTELIPGIECLDLSGNSVVTDHGMRAIAENLKNLRRLNINNCICLTDVSLEHVTRCTTSSTLQVLRASGLPTVRVDVLTALLQQGTHLRTLSLDCDLEAYCTEVVPHMCNLHILVTFSLLSDKALYLIAQHCKRLQELAIFSSHTYAKPTAAGLTDAHAETRVMHCAKKMATFEARLYTETGLMALIDGMPQLRVLGVQEMEIKQGLLTPLAQSLWRRLRPLLSVTAGFDHFAFNPLSE